MLRKVFIFAHFPTGVINSVLSNASWDYIAASAAVMLDVMPASST